MSRRARKNISLLLVGAQGRMGQEIEHLAAEARDLTVAMKIEAHADWPKSAKGVDVVIDFSSPAGLKSALRWCLKNKVPLVSGTTGLARADLSALKKASNVIPIFYSANMSAGIAFFFQILRRFHELADWDFEIEEVHHVHKKDKPSGTAILLQKTLERSIGRRISPISSRREGQIPGTHQVTARAPEEILRIEHVALNRKVFARGALSAARWLFDKKRPGLYDLSDLYKLD